MGLNSTPKGNRIHIGIFGKRNAGKSSVINAITGQNLSIVSEVLGTTTDPVSKAMELLPLGPVNIIDTPGLDDEGELGQLRILKSYQVLNKTDIALLVIDATIGKTHDDETILEKVREKNIPYIMVYNKCDLVKGYETLKVEPESIWVSSETGKNIKELKERIARITPEKTSKIPLVSDLLLPSDFVVLVVPIDKSAPKGRLILPQQQTIRDILDANGVSIVLKDDELRRSLQTLGKKPKLVICDSQVFDKVAADTPEDILLTSFSILFARYKGILDIAVKGVLAVNSLKEGDTVLISEGCTHHRQCEDIGTVKLPKWITKHVGLNINFEFTTGTEFPPDLKKYKMIVHCGGCTLNEREVKYRYGCATDQNIPITNYGILIAYLKGILKRSVEPFELDRIL